MLNTPIKKQFLISPFFAFFLIHTMQIGVGFLNFQRKIALKAGHDAWIAVIFVGIGVHLLIWMIYSILNKEKADLISIHRNMFGKWLGGMLSFVFSLYVFLCGLMYMETMLEIIRIWLFPTLNKWTFALVYLISVYYIIAGGFRTIVGVSFFGALVPCLFWFTLFIPLDYADFRNLLPIWDHSVIDMFLSAKEMVFNFLGFEFLFLYYPFFKQPEKSQKWVHLGHFVSMFIYLIITFLTIAYFSEGHLEKTVWPTLTMWKIIRLPIVERFEFMGVITWTMVVLPNICLCFWAASRGVKKIFKVQQKSILVLSLVIVFMAICSLSNPEIKQVNRIVSTAGFYIGFVYIPILFIIYQIRYKMRRKS
ncbi:GerAB/ArcD/ProY family transporter [Bacillus gaemokensis]|uniref:Uncharacterized protein n=1 Tax=Bacillus gaemokensis TaxID=574375 RepID=A0A073KA81_9BACI|nr:GerAB/ArcD/ProY family transporter [Bacillus gaemokensis]KEK23440.1 hypothetical protein BAGA_09145 [Bacillus gaemokensis]KYG25819.1 spore gernimation protein [Bacillus gaemokensis]